MIVVTYLLRQSITLYKNLGGLSKIWGGGLEPPSPIAGAATGQEYGLVVSDFYFFAFYTLEHLHICIIPWCLRLSLPGITTVHVREQPASKMQAPCKCTNTVFSC